MFKSDLLYLSHMYDLAERAVAKTLGVDRNAYDADENLRLALTHLVQMIGEAARHVSPQSRDAYPAIPWREITGMRHKIVHDYLDVDEDVVWEVVVGDLPRLITELRPTLRPEGQT